MINLTRSTVPPSAFSYNFLGFIMDSLHLRPANCVFIVRIIITDQIFECSTIRTHPYCTVALKGQTACFITMLFLHINHWHNDEQVTIIFAITYRFLEYLSKYNSLIYLCKETSLLATLCCLRLRHLSPESATVASLKGGGSGGVSRWFQFTTSPLDAAKINSILHISVY